MLENFENGFENTVTYLKSKFLNKKIRLIVQEHTFSQTPNSSEPLKYLSLTLDPYCPVYSDLKEYFQSVYPFSYRIISSDEKNIENNRPLRVTVQVTPQGIIKDIYLG